VSTPTELVVLPDVEELVCNYLRSVLPALHVGLVVPADDSIADVLPFVRVTRQAGLGLHIDRFDLPVVDIDVWHSSRQGVNETGQQVRAVMAAMQWYRDEATASVVTATSEVTGPQRLPEEDPQLYRLGFTVGLTVRALT
jgi:hypothetical protein